MLAEKWMVETAMEIPALFLSRLFVRTLQKEKKKKPTQRHFMLPSE